MRGSEERPEALIPPGNAWRPRRAWFAPLGLMPVFLIMASDQHYSFSVPAVAVCCAVAAFAILNMFGTFDDPVAPAHSVSLRTLGPLLVELLAASVALIASLRLAVSGVLPFPIVSSGLLITGELVWLVVAGYRLAHRSGVFPAQEADGAAPRTLLHRHGFWLIILNILLYVPLLGSYSLSDPWETHYGEVAREMLARDDWISLWWAQDGWFWSKPVLDFWLQGLSFSVSGVRFMPDQMLAAAAVGRFPQPEWAARLPIVALTLVATYFMYKAVAKVFGRRAGFLGGLVLTTAPYWYLIAHQSMTDMPYVAPLTASLALIVLGMRTDADARVQSFEIRVGARALRVSAFHLIFFCILLSVLPQIMYLLTRNVSLQLGSAPRGFRWHLDEFFSGSGGGNCGLPGNEECRIGETALRGLQPALAALIWTLVLGVLLFLNRGERRLQRLYFLLAWYFTALSALAKGAPGFVLPLVTALVALGVARRYYDYTRLELLGLVLLMGCVCLPWYVQAYVRHGPPFIDRLIFHDMYKRAFVHVHDTNSGDDVSFRYYVWQLGYGLFPWTGLCAAGLLWWLCFGDEAEDAQSEAAAFMALWFMIAFGMFTISLTKFHHYALPAVPPIAALTGVMLDRALGSERLSRARRGLAQQIVLALVASALLVYGVLRLLPGSLSGALVAGKEPPASLLVGLSALGLGLLVSAYAVRRWSLDEVPPGSAGLAGHESGMLGVLGLSAAVPVLLVGKDLFTSSSGEVDSSARLVHLFSYNYRRPWPESLHFDGIFTAFTAVAVLALLLFVWPRLRRHAVVLSSATALLWTLWALDVYMIKVSPHWGQRETLLTYYTRRKGPEEPIVGYQMNWKGENFYTGNRVPAFVSSGAKFKTWIGDQKAKGVRVIFFSTEHGRVSSLKGELGTVKSFEILTTKELNNKFMIARVEL